MEEDEAGGGVAEGCGVGVSAKVVGTAKMKFENRMAAQSNCRGRILPLLQSTSASIKKEKRLPTKPFPTPHCGVLNFSNYYNRIYHIRLATFGS